MDELTEKTLVAIREMILTEGWQHLKRDFQFQIEDLQEKINTVSPEYNEKNYTGKDLLIKTMKIMKDIIEYPDQYTALAQNPPQPEQQDPFEKNGTAAPQEFL